MTINIDVDYLLGPNGPFAEKFPGYEPREAQLEYARGVQGTLEAGDKPIVTEGPTGVGKSLGYLLPAIGNALTHGDVIEEDPETGETKTRHRSVIVVTGNIALRKACLPITCRRGSPLAWARVM